MGVQVSIKFLLGGEICSASRGEKKLPFGERALYNTPMTSILTECLPCWEVYEKQAEAEAERT